MRKFAAGGIFAGLLGIDQAVKQYIEENYDEEREEKTKIPGVLLRKFYNKGLIFSSFEKHSRLPLKASLIGTGVIFLADVKIFLCKGRKLCKAGLTLVTAGAISNTYDRIMKCAVVDYKLLRSLTANLADFYVVIGIMLAQLGRGKR